MLVVDTIRGRRTRQVRPLALFQRAHCRLRALWRQSSGESHHPRRRRITIDAAAETTHVTTNRMAAIVNPKLTQPLMNAVTDMIATATHLPLPKPLTQTALLREPRRARRIDNHVAMRPSADVVRIEVALPCQPFQGVRSAPSYGPTEVGHARSLALVTFSPASAARPVSRNVMHFRACPTLIRNRDQDPSATTLLLLVPAGASLSVHKVDVHGRSAQ
jgi:hypothetical protein